MNKSVTMALKDDRAQFLQRFFAMLRGFRAVTFGGDHGRNRIALLAVVVHNQDSNRALTRPFQFLCPLHL